MARRSACQMSSGSVGNCKSSSAVAAAGPSSFPLAGQAGNVADHRVDDFQRVDDDALDVDLFELRLPRRLQGLLADHDNGRPARLGIPRLPHRIHEAVPHIVGPRLRMEALHAHRFVVRLTGDDDRPVTFAGTGRSGYHARNYVDLPVVILPRQTRQGSLSWGHEGRRRSGGSGNGTSSVFRNHETAPGVLSQPRRLLTA